MERLNIKKSWKDWAFKIVAIAILLFIAYQLILINQKVRDHYEAFDENPLLFGAKKYDIVSGSGTTSKGIVIQFTQEKMWVENKNTPNVINFSISKLWDNQT